MILEEAMALASMNPMTNKGPKSDTLIVTNYNHDHDIDHGWDDYSACRTLDKDDEILSQDKNGKLVITKKDRLYKNVVEVYKVKSKNHDVIYESLIKEASLPYEERVSHKPNYIYEVFTGHKLYAKDQLKYDPLLEEFELKKFSKVVSSDAGNIESRLKHNRTSAPEGNIPARNPDEDLSTVTPVSTSLLASYDIDLAKDILGENASYIDILEDVDGYYAINMITLDRTESVRDMKDIDIEVIK